MSKVDLREASKKNWHVETVNGYPGDTNIQLGALMRIADATEKMASNYTTLQNDLAFYKRRFNEERAANERMARRISSLQGWITRLKKGQ